MTYRRYRRVFFLPEFGCRLYQNSKHIGGSFFFRRIWLQIGANFRTYSRVFLFHQNLVADLTKIKDIQEGLSFSPDFGCRPYQNYGHAKGSFFFTRILLQPVAKYRTYRRVFLFHQNFVANRTKIQDIK